MNDYLRVYGDLMRLPDNQKHLFFCRMLHDDKYLIPFLSTKETLQELLNNVVRYKLTDEDFQNFCQDWHRSNMRENVNERFYGEFVGWCRENIRNFTRMEKLMNLELAQ